jgi:hypothetical protein
MTLNFVYLILLKQFNFDLNYIYYILKYINNIEIFFYQLKQIMSIS